MSQPRKRSIRIHGHITSVTLEDEFWEQVQAIAERRGTSAARLVEQIDGERGDQNLASAIRVRVLQVVLEAAGPPIRARV